MNTTAESPQPPTVVSCNRAWGSGTIDALVADQGNTYAIVFTFDPSPGALACECGVRVTLPCDWTDFCPHMEAVNNPPGTAFIAEQPDWLAEFTTQTLAQTNPRQWAATGARHERRLRRRWS